MARISIRTRRGVVLLVALTATACSGSPIASGPSGAATTPPPASIPAPTAAASPASSPAVAVIEGWFDVGGHELWISCKGTGTPTVVFEAGLGSGANAFAGLRADLDDTTRACIYDRAGLGQSPPRPGPRERSAGAMADELARLLVAAGIDGPIVLVGHSYGGMIVRIAADREPATVAGLVLVDAASGHQFEGPGLDNDQAWVDGAALVDREASAPELAAVDDLGSIPLVVLTQGQISGEFEIDWAAYQDELATLSSNVLHLVAQASGHGIQDDAPKLVAAGIRAVIRSAADATALPACDSTWVALGAACFETTMTARLEAWDTLRAAVSSKAGTFPSGTYRAELTGTQATAVTGKKANFGRQEFTWVLARGRWTVSIVTDGRSPETITDVYSATGEVLTLRIPTDWRVPGTSGVNRFRWSADGDGTVHLEQIDDEIRDESFTVPWIRTGNAPGG